MVILFYCYFRAQLLSLPLHNGTLAKITNGGCVFIFIDQPRQQCKTKSKQCQAKDSKSTRCGSAIASRMVGCLSKQDKKIEIEIEINFACEMKRKRKQPKGNKWSYDQGGVEWPQLHTSNNTKWVSVRVCLSVCYKRWRHNN